MEKSYIFLECWKNLSKIRVDEFTFFLIFYQQFNLRMKKRCLSEYQRTIASKYYIVNDRLRYLRAMNGLFFITLKEYII